MVYILYNWIKMGKSSKHRIKKVYHLKFVGTKGRDDKKKGQSRFKRPP